MRVIISNASEQPIYEQIAGQIRAQIIGGELLEGQALPSIRRLAKDLSVSVITTKRAYDDLESEGFIDSVAGKGTFVSVQNKDFLREKQRTVVEEHLRQAVSLAQRYGITQEELRYAMEVLWGDDE